MATPLATAEEVRRIDELSIATYGVPGVALMEHAGGQAAAIALRELPAECARGVLVVCGSGNNGGDGYVMARHLVAAGVPVRVIAVGEPPERDAKTMADAWKTSGGKVEPAPLGAIVKAAKECGLVVDALVGTGFRSEPRQPIAGAIAEIAQSGTRILALDVPSGVDASTGEIPGAALYANLTVTFGLGKIGLESHPGARLAGRVIVAPLGWPAAALHQVPLGGERIDGEEMRTWIPRIDLEAHKGQRGHVLVIAGRDLRPGAAALCCHAAFRAGAGLVTLGTTAGAAGAAVAAVPETMVEHLPSENGALSAKAADAVLALAAKSHAIVFGPGVGLEKGAGAVLEALLTKPGAPMVIDADGLTLLAAADPEKKRWRDCVLTPHPGEMGRLLGIETAEVQAARLRCARDAATRYRADVVLKGARTLVASREGHVSVNVSGNPGLATAGAGDVLAGIAAAWIARGMRPLDAVKAAVWAHGAAADVAAADFGGAGFLARDVADRVPRVVAGRAAPAPATSTRSRRKSKAESKSKRASKRTRSTARNAR